MADHKDKTLRLVVDVVYNEDLAKRASVADVFNIVERAVTGANVHLQSTFVVNQEVLDGDKVNKVEKSK